MPKTEKELKELKERLDSIKEELKELSEEELNQVSGGNDIRFDSPAAFC